MIEKIAWEAFKKTGDINTYLEFNKIRNIEKGIKEKSDETSKNKWNSNCRT